MKTWMLRSASLIAMSTSLLACVGVEDDMAAETDDVAAVGDEVSEKAAGPTLLPLVVELYQDMDYGGDRRHVIRQEGMLGHGDGCTPGLWFGDVVSSVKVRKGPDYDAWVAQNSGRRPYVYLYQDDLYRGRRLALTIGGYPDLRDLDFENVASSISIQGSTLPPADLREPTRSAPAHPPVSVILEAHTEPQNLRCIKRNYKMTLLGTAMFIDRFYGSAFHDKLSSIDVLRGTNFDPTKRFTLCVNEACDGYQHGFYHDTSLVPDLRDLSIDNAVSAILVEQ